MRLGKVVKSNSHCDYVVELDDQYSTEVPPEADDYGFGSFVKLEDEGKRHWAVGIVYNTQLVNPMFFSNGPRLSSEPDPLFTPDLISETRTMLGVVLVGTLEHNDQSTFGKQGIPKVVVPINTPAQLMSQHDIHHFHQDVNQRPQFAYYSHLLRCGGHFASDLMDQILTTLVEEHLFTNGDQRALELLRKEIRWKNTMGAMRSR
ncbi:MAG: hypothetical protein AAGA75_08120 [Cyanobacteria bacterium P01_E01_bin.6]